MVKTYCKNCVFNNVDNKDCWFEIPDLVKDKKQIEKKDGYFLISDYQCMYGSDMSNNTDVSLTFEDVLKFAINKNLLRYYLFIDMTHVEDNESYLNDLISLINKMDNPPNFVSFLMYYSDNNHILAKYIEKNISKNIKWKIHNINKPTTIEHGMFVNIATNLGSNYSSCILFSIASNDAKTDIIHITDRITFAHMSQVVLQEQAHLFMKDIDSLDGVLIPNFIYKEMIGYGDKNIVNTIKKIKNDDKDYLRIVFYD